VRTRAPPLAAGAVLRSARQEPGPSQPRPRWPASPSPAVHAAENNTIQVALVGCGGRGTGAASQSPSTKHGPVKLVAMADVFANRLKSAATRSLKGSSASKVDVPEDRKFVGFDAYKKAMDCLKPGDIAILATPPAFRWVQFTYAIEKGLNVFMEKPVTVDGPTVRGCSSWAKQGGEEPQGRRRPHVPPQPPHAQELASASRTARSATSSSSAATACTAGRLGSRLQEAGGSETDVPGQRFHSFIWASGGNFSDFYIHIIDHLCWMKNAWPVEAQALGGRHYRQSPDEGLTYVDQNFDVYGVEYTYADGTKFDFDGRCMTGCEDIYSSYSTAPRAVPSFPSGDCGGPSSHLQGPD
jgi:hypothetical protein